MQHQWAERRLAEQSQRPNDHRTPWQRDRARILHSAAFAVLPNRVKDQTIIVPPGKETEPEFCTLRLFAACRQKLKSWA